MNAFAKGIADQLVLGDWNAACYECGRKRKASTLLKHWQGYYVCKEHWEPRQTQDFVRNIPDVQTPPWTQSMELGLDELLQEDEGRLIIGTVGRLDFLAV